MKRGRENCVSGEGKMKEKSGREKEIERGFMEESECASFRFCGWKEERGREKTAKIAITTAKWACVNFGNQ